MSTPLTASKPARSAREIAEARTAPPPPSPARPLDASATGLQRLYSERERIKSAAAEEIARVGEAAARIIAIRAPMDAMLQQRSDALAVIKRAEAYRSTPLGWIGEYREWLAALFATENGIADGLLFVSRERRHWTLARDFLTELDQWIAERKSAIPPLEARIRDYAAEHNLDVS